MMVTLHLMWPLLNTIFTIFVTPHIVWGFTFWFSSHWWGSQALLFLIVDYLMEKIHFSMVDGHLVVWSYYCAFAWWITLLTHGCTLRHVSYFSWIISVTMYDGVMIVCHYDEVFYMVLFYWVWRGHTWCLMELAPFYVPFVWWYC